MKPEINSLYEARKLAYLSITTAQTLLENGAEIYRVEDTSYRICETFKGIENINVFATHTMIIVSFSWKDEDIVTMRRNRWTDTNLLKIIKINDFSRKFVKGNTSLDEGCKRVETIRFEKNYNFRNKIIAGSIGSSMYTWLFSGGINDCIISLIATLSQIYIIGRLDKYDFVFFVKCFIGGMISGLIAAIAVSNGFAENIDSIIIGSMMPMLPGVAITNSVRDFMSGELISGLTGMALAVFTAIGIAMGTGFVLSLYVRGVFQWI